jgi:hypothetical protein
MTPGSAPGAGPEGPITQDIRGQGLGIPWIVGISTVLHLITLHNTYYT